MSDELRERIIQALSDAGAICGEYCGDEPGDRTCSTCKSVYRRYADAVMAVVDQVRPDLTEDLRETARLLRSTTQRAEKAEDEVRRLQSYIDELTASAFRVKAQKDKAEAALGRVCQLASRWAMLRTHGSAAYELRAVLNEED